jgi:Domain of unknown function (DUF4279)
MSEPMQGNVAEASVWAHVTGRFDPDRLTALGVRPYTVRRFGEPTRRPNHPAQEDRWSLRSELESGDFGPSLERVVTQLESIGSPLSDLVDQNGVRIMVTFSVYLLGSPDSVVPDLFLDHEMVRRLAALHADLNFDINLLEEDDPEQ